MPVVARNAATAMWQGLVVSRKATLASAMVALLQHAAAAFHAAKATEAADAEASACAAMDAAGDAMGGGGRSSKGVLPAGGPGGGLNGALCESWEWISHW